MIGRRVAVLWMLALLASRPGAPVVGEEPGAPAPHPTARVRDAGMGAVPPLVDPARMGRIEKLIDARDGAGLLRELEGPLLRGVPGYSVLHGVFAGLSRDTRRWSHLTTHYQITFALSQLAMLHEPETAELMHYLFAATRSDSRSLIQQWLVGYAPVFLRFHGDRFPDFRRDLEQELIRRVETGDGRLHATFAAIRSLGFRPPIDFVARHLVSASTLQRMQLITGHLEDRDDAEAVALLVKTIESVADFTAQKTLACLRALARMTAPEAAAALESYLRSPAPGAADGAVLAFFGLARGPESAGTAFRYLDSRATPAGKKRLLGALRLRNREVLEAVAARVGEIRDPETRELVARYARAGRTQR